MRLGDVEGLRGIGQMSRESGLTVSALRFYDGAGVLGPAWVDPHTGYRYYAPDQLAVARLVAALRRVGMPLAGIRRVLARRHDAAAVDALLAGHLLRLEQGLADARRELSTVRSLLDIEETAVPPATVPPTTVTVAGADLAAALRAVRFATGSEPPALGGVLFDVAGAAVTLVATDRYRLAVSSAPVLALDGPPVAALVPAAFADAIAATATGPVTLTVDGGSIGVRATDAVLEGTLIPDAFPDHRRLMPAGGDDSGVPVGPDLRAALAAAPTRTVRRDADGVDCEVAVLGIGPDGAITVGEGAGVAGGERVGVDREFLLEALDAGGEGQLQLHLDGPVAPLVIRSPRSVSLLMPVRL